AAESEEVDVDGRSLVVPSLPIAIAVNNTVYESQAEAQYAINDGAASALYQRQRQPSQSSGDAPTAAASAAAVATAAAATATAIATTAAATAAAAGTAAASTATTAAATVTAPFVIR
ncbi:unnamed protein product, partial [Ectocarpus sp. 4 AP-2014]